MKLSPYPKYKPSGVEWLGNVPAHWGVKRLKTSATCWVSNVDKVPAEDELPVRLCNYTDVYYHDHITPDMDLMETTATADEIRRFGLQEGDIVITKDSEEWSDIAVPALVKKSAPDLVCGYHLAIIRSRPEKLFGDYLLRVFQSCAVNQQFQIAASGVTRYGLPKASIGDAWIPLPDAEEQRAIAAFLNRETGRIDELVAKKREFIERLKEKRTALISQAVTKGIDPNVKLKPSGVEWLGDVPEHWEVKRLKWVGETIIGLTYSPTDVVSEGEGTLVLRSSNIQGGRIVLDDNVFVSSEIPQKLRTKPNDILICTRNGSRDLVGKTGKISERESGLTFGAFTAVFRSPVNDYMFYVFNSGLFSFQAGLYQTSTIFQLTNGTINAFQIPLPPPAEQRTVAVYLDDATSKLDVLLGKVEKAVERLQEYRTALITAAVTGKIDVRKESVCQKNFSAPSKN